MKKLLIASLLLAALLLGPAVSLGETVSIEPIFQYMPGISAVSGTQYVIVTRKEDSTKAAFNTAGEQLTPFRYKTLSYLKYGFFVGRDGDGINNRALIYESGAQIARPAYGAFVAYSRKWAAGYVLSPATEAAYDYKRGEEFFNIDRCDIFYVGQQLGQIRPIASLQREEFSAADVHGDFIAIQDRSGHIALYDRYFTAYDLEMTDITQDIHALDNYAIVNLATGETVARDYTAVKEKDFGYGMLLMATRYNFRGQKVSGLLDLKGGEVMPVNYTISTISGDYVVITNASKQKGLYSISQGKVLVPCEYYNIMVGSVSTDNYVHNGYVAVENGNLRGYVDTRTGEVSCPIQYDRKSVTTIGCSTFWKTGDGEYMLAAADGVETQVQVDEIYKKTRGNGYLLVAKKDGMYGVIDWHGSEVLPFIHGKVITITDDSRALLRTGTGVEMDRIMIGE